MALDSIEPIERWTAKRRVALVVSILKGETSVAEAARTHGLTVAEVDDWREKFLLRAENALRTRPKDEEAVKEPSSVCAAEARAFRRDNRAAPPSYDSPASLPGVAHINAGTPIPPLGFRNLSNPRLQGRILLPSTAIPERVADRWPGGDIPVAH
jgi:transposase-like protein